MKTKITITEASKLLIEAQEMFVRDMADGKITEAHKPIYIGVFQRVKAEAERLLRNAHNLDLSFTKLLMINGIADECLYELEHAKFPPAQPELAIVGEP